MGSAPSESSASSARVQLRSCQRYCTCHRIHTQHQLVSPWHQQGIGHLVRGGVAGVLRVVVACHRHRAPHLPRRLVIGPVHTVSMYRGSCVSSQSRNSPDPRLRVVWFLHVPDLYIRLCTYMSQECWILECWIPRHHIDTACILRYSGGHTSAPSVCRRRECEGQSMAADGVGESASLELERRVGAGLAPRSSCMYVKCDGAWCAVSVRGGVRGCGYVHLPPHMGLWC